MGPFVAAPGKGCQLRAAGGRCVWRPRIGGARFGMPQCRRAANVIERPEMTTTGPDATPQPIVPNTDIALIIYILYFVGYCFIFPAVIGVIMAHIQLQTADPMLATHYRFQIRTFWIGLLYIVVGTVLSLIVIGAAVLV